jgi:predicted ArsR family transcriptional regulator
MLDLVRQADGGITAAQIVDGTGLHPSTVRAHLDRLTVSGLLTRRRHSDGSPGRPAWRYYAVPAPEEGGRHDGANPPYRELAAALVRHVARDANDPRAAGVRAGRDWGRALAAVECGSTERAAPVDGLLRVLDQLGFTPRLVERQPPATAVIQLRSCPFLDLALTDPDVVCGVHQGVISGALAVLNAAVTDIDLQPFALPGACVVRVRTSTAGALAGALPQDTIR